MNHAAADPVSEARPVPLSLYVHIPWCARKCPYCDFNSHAARDPLDQAGYVDALLLDLDHETMRQPLPAVGSVFIGGGTPSLFDGAAIGRLLDGVARRLTLAADLEITLEANPGTAEAGRFADYLGAGVNRLSLGVQSLDDRRLAALGRIHSAREALDAYRMARAAGFDNINLDLMYGLPGQALDGALEDLRQVVALGPEHLSWYQLTLEPNTLFHHHPPTLPDDDTLAGMMDAGQAMLAEAGYRQYEISAYAQAGRRCRHNLNYWEFGDYLGIGAGAHGKLTAPGSVIRRRSKQRQPAAYIAAAAQGAIHDERELDSTDLPVEFFLNALRLNAGVPAQLFGQRTGLSLQDIAAPLARARAQGLIGTDASRLQPTPLGLRYLNDLLALFEPD
ncbi:MAG: radical SAM family heme chaperone HemW [Chromatiaceae bacterium]|nr:radical SAM family heme chaperone HemW [Chromatiaceae bacterium]